MNYDRLRRKVRRQDIEELGRALAGAARPPSTMMSTRLSNFEAAADAYRARRRRDACFGQYANLFGEPAWDILLDLYAAQALDELISVSSAGLAACVPSTTALRHLHVLEERGLIVRVPDPDDRRRTFVRLSEEALEMMSDWISQASGRP